MAEKNNKPGFIDSVLSGLRGWRQITDALNESLVPNVAATAPWLAPILPGYMVFDGLNRVLDVWFPIAVVGGLTVEFVGVAVISTAVELWQYNEAKKAGQRTPKARKGKKAPKAAREHAPAGLAMAMTGLYVATVLVVNVLLDGGDVIQKIAKGLLSSLTIVAAVTVALRWQHASRLSNKAKHNEEMRKARVERELLKERAKVAEGQANLQKVGVQVAEKPETFGKWRRWNDLPEAERLKVSNLALAGMQTGEENWRGAVMTELRSLYGAEERTAYQWIGYAERDYSTLFTKEEVLA